MNRSVSNWNPSITTNEDRRDPRDHRAARFMRQALGASYMLFSLLALMTLFSMLPPGVSPFAAPAEAAVTHATAIRNAMADAVVDAIDAGASAGTLEWQTSGDVEVCTLTFSDPAFGAAASGTATANAITSDTSCTGGTVAKFVVKDSNGTTVFSGSVTATGGGGDIELSSVVISAGQTGSLSSLTYTAPN